MGETINLQFGVKTPTYSTAKANDPYADEPTLTILAHEGAEDKQRVGARMMFNAKAREILGLLGKKVPKGISENIMPARNYNESNELVNIVFINGAKLGENVDESVRNQLIRFSKKSVISNKPLLGLIVDLIGVSEEVVGKQELICKLSIIEHPNFGNLLSLDASSLVVASDDATEEIPTESEKTSTSKK
jgi:hypothetical protein